MIVGFTKTMHTHIVGQPKRNSYAQNKRVDSFVYSFVTTIKLTDMDWNGVYDVIVECLAESMQIPCENDTLAIKDMEISLDIPSEQYTVRFTAFSDLKDTTYAAEVMWEIQEVNGGLEIDYTYPTKCINNSCYAVSVKAAALSLEDIETLSQPD